MARKAILVLALCAIMFSVLGTRPVAAAATASASKNPQAASCTSRLYNRGLWFEVVMDRCAAQQMLKDWSKAWNIFGPGFDQVTRYIPGFQGGWLVKKVMEYGFSVRINNALRQGKGTLSLSSMWWNFPAPLVWKINVY